MACIESISNATLIGLSNFDARIQRPVVRLSLCLQFLNEVLQKLKALPGSR